MPDQHYMIDRSLIKRIAIYAELKKSDKVVEIGAGTGTLSKELAGKCDLTVIEIEEDKEPLLKKITNKVIIGNALDVLPKLNFSKIVANIPYSISEPLLKIILVKRPEFVVLTTGKNFSELLKDKTSKIGILANALYEINVKEIVEPFAFEPKPKTKSAVILLKSRQNPQEYISRLILQHDKKIKNALINLLMKKGMTKKQAKEKLSKHRDKFLEKGILTLSNKDIRKLQEILNSL